MKKSDTLFIQLWTIILNGAAFGLAGTLLAHAFSLTASIGFLSLAVFIKVRS